MDIRLFPGNEIILEDDTVVNIYHVDLWDAEVYPDPVQYWYQIDGKSFMFTNKDIDSGKIRPKYCE